MSKQCSKCGQFKVISVLGLISAIGVAMAFPAIILTIVFPPIGILVWMLAIIMFLCPLALPILKAIDHPIKYYCNNCHYTFYEDGK